MERYPEYCGYPLALALKRDYYSGIVWSAIIQFFCILLANKEIKY